MNETELIPRAFGQWAPTRLDVWEALLDADEEMTVTEITESVDVAAPTVYRSLDELEEAGLAEQTNDIESILNGTPTGRNGTLWTGVDPR